MKRVIIKKGRERSLLRKHPWIFSSAVKRIEGSPENGETVDVVSEGGDFLGRGAFSPSSQIQVRIWTFEKSEEVNEAFIESRIQAAHRLRQSFGLQDQTSAYRLVYGEADGLPGVIADRYGDYIVCQFLSAGAEFWKNIVVDNLMGFDGVKGVYERSDAGVRKKEGLGLTTGVLRGEAPPEVIEIEELGLKFLVDVVKGHKTGFYLDQRENRDLVRSCSQEAEVLNCFSYTGGFGLAALKGGAAHVTNIEDVAGLVAFTGKNIQRNGFSEDSFTNVKADVFQLLRRYEQDKKSFDIIIMDPPKFAESQAHLPRACRGYKDINRLAFNLLRPGGLLFTFSCSGLLKADLFQKIIADAAIDSGRDVQLIKWLGQGPDHPVKLSFPESLYLKGLFTCVNG